MTGPSPVDRGKPGSKIHVLSDREGLPLAVAVTVGLGAAWYSDLGQARKILLWELK